MYWSRNLKVSLASSQCFPVCKACPCLASSTGLLLVLVSDCEAVAFLGAHTGLKSFFQTLRIEHGLLCPQAGPTMLPRRFCMNSLSLTIAPTLGPQHPHSSALWTGAALPAGIRGHIQQSLRTAGCRPKHQPRNATARQSWQATCPRSCPWGCKTKLVGWTPCQCNLGKTKKILHAPILFQKLIFGGSVQQVEKLERKSSLISWTSAKGTTQHMSHWQNLNWKMWFLVKAFIFGSAMSFYSIWSHHPHPLANCAWKAFLQLHFRVCSIIDCPALSFAALQLYMVWYDTVMIPANATANHSCTILSQAQKQALNSVCWKKPGWALTATCSMPFIHSPPSA